MTTNTQTWSPQAHDAMREAIGRHASDVASALGLSRSLVEKWLRPSERWHDSGERSPLHRVALAIEAAVAAGRDEWSALAPLRWLAARYGYRLERIEPVEPGSALEVVADLSARAGHLTAVYALAWNDGELTDAERRMIHSAYTEELRALDALCRSVEAA